MNDERMSNADMIQYCDEALAWEDFGPVDIYFFESVKKILLGESSPFETSEDFPNDLMGIERPVRDIELEPEYHKFADIYYEEGDENLPDYSKADVSDGDGGFFVRPESGSVHKHSERKSGGFKVRLRAVKKG
ncbi:MAG: hypothetical protein NC340_02090 [Ruminococcus flavefaciens]|nr:hypothetical protein [Ruminococcus flavefaciens]MCM1228937.1 hypothetical protein [Ruminococcus flavefaciens]